ncbi:hypothetical protein COB28_00870 [Candidatus Dependentiae bacterium]|nr:MAG: hypothetical protein COB28_00870 [Candidatus Dependentiae bacterium]
MKNRILIATCAIFLSISSIYGGILDMFKSAQNKQNNREESLESDIDQLEYDINLLEGKKLSMNKIFDSEITILLEQKEGIQELIDQHWNQDDYEQIRLNQQYAKILDIDQSSTPISLNNKVTARQKKIAEIEAEKTELTEQIERSVEQKNETLNKIKNQIEKERLEKNRAEKQLVEERLEKNKIKEDEQEKKQIAKIERLKKRNQQKFEQAKKESLKSSKPR